jgi:hypothetical protein
VSAVLVGAAMCSTCWCGTGMAAGVMPSPRARVPTKNTHSTVRWDNWVFPPRRCRPFSALPAVIVLPKLMRAGAPISQAAATFGSR